MERVAGIRHALQQVAPRLREGAPVLPAEPDAYSRAPSRLEHRSRTCAFFRVYDAARAFRQGFVCVVDSPAGASAALPPHPTPLYDAKTDSKTLAAA